jgi:hypothetical protein
LVPEELQVVQFADVAIFVNQHQIVALVRENVREVEIAW